MFNNDYRFLLPKFPTQIKYEMISRRG